MGYGGYDNLKKLQLKINGKEFTARSPSRGLYLLQFSVDEGKLHDQMETFSEILVFCVGNTPVTGKLPSQRPVTRSFDAFFDLLLNKQLSKQSWDRWFGTPSRSLWCHCNGLCRMTISINLGDVKSFMLTHCDIAAPYGDVHLRYHYRRHQAPEPMLTSHNWGSVTFTGEQFCS